MPASFWPILKSGIDFFLGCFHFLLLFTL
jgi:hypothetical protein